MTRSNRQLVTIAFAAALACGQASAASYEGTALVSNLRFELTDLTPTDASVAQYHFAVGGAPTLIGSRAAANVDLSQQPSNQFAPTIASSFPVVIGGAVSSPFDTVQAPRTVSAHGQTAVVEVNQNLIAASVLTEADSGYYGYAEAAIGALSLDSTGFPGLTQNTIVLAAHTQLTIRASASVIVSLLDEATCPGCDAQFTGYAALIGGDQFAAYIAANQGDSALRQSALTAAGISFVGLDQTALSSSLPYAEASGFLSLTFTNDTDTEQGYGFLANAWLNGNSKPGSALAVPEPETAGLALAGLLVSGVALRRRRRA
jgi:hypothetical protein